MHDNIIINTFFKGGPIMWPLLLTSIVMLAVVLERTFFWIGLARRRNSGQLDQVYARLESGDTAGAASLAQGSADPIVNTLWHGLNHKHASLQGALSVAAGQELQRAGRFLSVMDTIITLAPLLGLLGTVTGLMMSFKVVGNEDLAVAKVQGGIAEALIATACGLGIAIFTLVPYNLFSAKLQKLQFELETAATNLELLLLRAAHPSAVVTDVL